MHSTYVTHQIVTPIHGRYLLRVPESPTRGPLRNRPMLVGFHGYGESAETQMARMEGIPGSALWTLVSVQALHRFYGRDREVVASWMTSQDRDELIDDNLRYTRSAVTEAVHLTGEPQALVYLGYSQGAAMGWRAAMLGGRRIDGLITFGGEVPPEFAVRPLGECPPVLLGRGRRDPRYSVTRFNSDVEMLAARFVAIEPCEVDGGHEWSEAFAEEAGRFLSRLVRPPGPADADDLPHAI
jgi:predicted esterase